MASLIVPVARPGPAVDLMLRQRTIAEAREQLSELRARPGFEAAMLRMIDETLSFAERYQVYAKVFSDLAAAALGGIAIHLDANGGLQHRTLRAVGGGTDFISAGRATAMLWRMRSLGMVLPDAAYQSGKPRLYRPQPMLMEAYEAHTLAMLQGPAMIDESARQVVAAWDAASYRRLRDAQFRLLLAAIRRGDVNGQPLHGVSYMAMGIPITLSIIALAFADDGRLVEGPISLSLSLMARRWGVSRSHVRQIVRRLARAGLKDDPADPRRYVVTPQFRDAFETYFASSFLMMLDAVEWMDRRD
jgi:hypothetical protein